MTSLSDAEWNPDQLLSIVPAIVFESRLNFRDSEFILSYINRSAVKLLGLGPETFDLSKFSFAEFIHLVHPDDVEGLNAAIAEATTKVGRFHQQCRLFIPDGGLRWLDIVADPEPYPDGWMFWRGVATDITPLKEAENRSRYGQERLALATRAAGVGIWEFDFAADQYRLDERMCEILRADMVNLAPGDTEGTYRIGPKDWEVLIHAEDLPRLRRDRDLALADGMTVSFTFRTRTPPAEPRYVSAVLQLFRKPDGSLDRTVGTAMDVTEVMRLQKQLEHMAAHDALTGLPNRMAFEERLQVACDQAREKNREHALCFMDLDRFKIVNDTAGHAAGDAFLRLIGDLLRKTCKDTHFTARLGGDEFALLLYDSSLSRAEHIARTLIDAIAAIRLSWDRKIYDIGASIGITAITGRSSGPADLMGQADVACYAAKSAGRNRVVIYGGRNGTAERHHHEIMVASGIREAIETGRFQLFAQEIKALKPTEEASGRRTVELLLRMTDSTGRVLRPGTFIPAAERYDLMGSLDRWVIENALVERGQALAAIADLSVSINLSANSLNDPLFWPFLKTTLEASQLAPAQVNFEITETALINNIDSARTFMAAVRKAGHALILDDFGTGLSSFTYLKQSPVDGLKIDGSFIRNIKDNPVDRVIVEAINDICHKLGIRTVAEFVEDAETLVIVKDIGIDQAQGYVVGRPVPLDMMIEDHAARKMRLM
jgi:diguanylate cyclase (GGDEF)-like protein